MKKYHSCRSKRTIKVEVGGRAVRMFSLQYFSSSLRQPDISALSLTRAIDTFAAPVQCPVSFGIDAGQLRSEGAKLHGRKMAYLLKGCGNGFYVSSVDSVSETCENPDSRITQFTKESLSVLIS